MQRQKCLQLRCVLIEIRLCASISVNDDIVNNAIRQFIIERRHNHALYFKLHFNAFCSINTFHAMHEISRLETQTVLVCMY